MTITADGLSSCGEPLKRQLGALAAAGRITLCCYSACWANLTSGILRSHELLGEGIALIEECLADPAHSRSSAPAIVEKLESLMSASMDSLDGDTSVIAECVHKTLLVLTDPSVDNACLSLSCAFQVIESCSMEKMGINRPSSTVVNSNELFQALRQARTGTVLVKYIEAINRTNGTLMKGGCVVGLT